MRTSLLSLCLFATLCVPAFSQDTKSANVVPDTGAAKPNLHLWVPDEEMKVWDPINTNVNPVPWRLKKELPGPQNNQDIMRHHAIGKAVRVEGIAWGYDVKTEMPKSRIIFEGGTVLVDGIDLNAATYRGRLVQIVGTLELRSMAHADLKRALPFYYCVNASEVNLLSQVSEPKPVLMAR